LTDSVFPEGFLPVGNEHDDFMPAIEVPSHISGPSSEAFEQNWECENINPILAESHGIRRFNYLCPVPPDNDASVRRQIKSAVDHTLYFYPISFEKFEQRYY
jgi:hypothetical protein